MVMNAVEHTVSAQFRARVNYTIMNLINVTV